MLFSFAILFFWRVFLFAGYEWFYKKHDKKIKSGDELHLELTPATKIFEKLKDMNKKLLA